MRRKLEDLGIDMTPMIDVVFQLIIFFIVTITMAKEQNRDIRLELAPHGITVKDQDPRTFEVEVDRRGWITIHNAHCTPKQLRDLLQRRYDKFGEFPITIRGDARAMHRDIRAVMDMCTGVGLYRIKFIAVKEKKI